MELYNGDHTTNASIPLFCEGEHWLLDGHAMYVSDASTGILEAVTAKAMEVELEMYPLTGADGEVVADIRYYGAVNANCAYPDVAYEFLRRLLLKETQWERNVSQTKLTLSIGMLAYGYPVRQIDAVPALYETYFEWGMNGVSAAEAAQEEEIEGFQKRKDAIRNVELGEQDVPILMEEIDVVRFPVQTLERKFQSLLSQLNDPETGEATDVSLSNLANEYINYLYAHLSGQLDTE